MNHGMLKLFSLLLLTIILNASQYNEFTLIKKGTEDNNTLLLIGGIQGDEPGGFVAASLIATHYNITKGSVWIVPNLNFDSIIYRSRGRFGDMNRKFARISKSDPDYNNVARIKGLIKKENVSLVLNLHDGSGFYRLKYEDKYHTPYKWGQSSIIDQTNITHSMYNELFKISNSVVNHINNNLLDDEHSYRIKNTKTRTQDKEMAKSLTYFAINNNKAAFGNEASKSLLTHKRVYYHLLAIEKYMEIMGIKFERKFKLNIGTLKDVIDNDISIAFYDNKICLPLSQMRNTIRYFPVTKDFLENYKVSNPLMTILKKKNYYEIRYGNRRVTRLYPSNFIVDNYNKKIKLKIDGVYDKEVSLGSIVNVKNSFKVEKSENVRVNIIGYSNKKYKNESDITIDKDSIRKQFSIDKKATLYRVEFYDKIKNNFLGTILVDFSKKKYSKKQKLLSSIN